MHPILFEGGPVPLYTYDLFVALALLAGVAIARCEARRLQLSAARMSEFCVFGLLGAMAGSRLLYALADPTLFWPDPLQVVTLTRSGFLFSGGLLGAAAVGGLYFRGDRRAGRRFFDAAAPGVLFGAFVGRLGCLAAGCCYGRVSDLPWAVTFRHPGTFGPFDQSLHPTQAYAAAAHLSVFTALWAWRRRCRTDGQVFWLALLGLGLAGSVIEPLRGDFRGVELPGGLSVSQLIAVAGAVLAARVLWSSRQAA